MSVNQQILLFLLCSIFPLKNAAYASSTCAFDKSYFTKSKSKYEANAKIIAFVWNESKKSGKGITRNGDLFSVKYWSCEHLGIHAIMLIGPYPPLDSTFIRNKIISLATIILDTVEIDILKKQLAKESFAVLSKEKKIDIKDSLYSEFYVAYSLVNDSLIIEIKWYKN